MQQYITTNHRRWTEEQTSQKENPFKQNREKTGQPEDRVGYVTYAIFYRNSYQQKKNRLDEDMPRENWRLEKNTE